MRNGEKKPSKKWILQPPWLMPHVAEMKPNSLPVTNPQNSEKTNGYFKPLKFGLNLECLPKVHVLKAWSSYSSVQRSGFQEMNGSWRL